MIILAGIWERLKVNQVLFPASSSAIILARCSTDSRIIIYLKRGVHAGRRYVDRRGLLSRKRKRLSAPYSRSIVNREYEWSNKSHACKRYHASRDIRKSFFLLRYVVNISSLERFAKQLKVVIITFFEACALSFVISANRHYPRRYCDTPLIIRKFSRQLVSFATLPFPMPLNLSC